MSAINVTTGTNGQAPVTLDSSLRPIPPGTFSLERVARVAEAWFDYNGDLRTIDGSSNVTTGAYRRTL